jgi:hypothetical protein
VSLLAGTISEVYVGFRVMPQASDTGARLLAFYNTGVAMATVRREGFGTGNPFPFFYGYRGDDVTILGGGGLPANYGKVMYVEVYYKPHASSGRLVIKINGRIDCDYTGQTVTGSQSVFHELWIGGGSLNDYVGFYINDIVVDDANWPGMCNMAVLAPNEAGAAAQWTPHPAPNWECVNDKIPTSDEYTSVNSDAQVDSFGVESLPAEAAKVKSMNVHVFPAKEGVPTTTQIKPLLRTSSTDYEGAGIAPATVFKDVKNIWEENPYTNNPWEVGEINAMEIGYKSAT